LTSEQLIAYNNMEKGRSFDTVEVKFNKKGEKRRSKGDQCLE